jgi:flagellar biosynthesis protein FlhB
MEQGDSEQNKTEEPTPFKLKRARERGVVARGIDLGFFAALCGLAMYAIIAGDDSIAAIGQSMRLALAVAPMALEPNQAIETAAALYWPAFQIVAAMAVTIMMLVALFEIVQVRGIVFTAKPLKPDFSRINPAKGLKRLFSMRMLKETLKSIIKLAAYGAAGYLALKYAFDTYARSIDTAPRLGEAMHGASLRLLFMFILVALFVAIIDQVISRREFLKQMRMSRGELTREHKEREGEPRMKQKRKQLHAEFASQARSFGSLKGSDMLIVNPQHYAIALAYDSKRMDAPRVTAKARNLHALELKRRAALLSIAVFEQPELARALYKACDRGDAVPASRYRDVADLYLQLMRDRAGKDADAGRA